MNTDWRQNPQLLAQKIIALLGNGELSIDALDMRCRAKGINGYVLDEALALLHKLPQVRQSVKKGSLYYSLQVAPVKKPVTAFSHVAWVRNNYPSPEVFVMPFPEIDLGSLFVKPKRYVKKKRYEYASS